MADPKPLTREELARFLPTQRAVRAFERLFELIPPDLDTAQLESGAVRAAAQLALGLAEGLKAMAELIALAPVSSQSSTQIEDLAPPSLPQLEVDNLLPPVQVGTLGEQQADQVKITGGAITANLTTNQTTLLASSQALTDGAAAAVGTLNNAPTAGNPSKWVAIDDNGTTRYIPAW